MVKKIIYETKWAARNKQKEYPHGWGFDAPFVEFPADIDPADVARICKDELSDLDFDCIGVIPHQLLIGVGAMGEKARSEYDYEISTKHNSVCLSRAGDTEPIFVIRAKDPTAQNTVMGWVSANMELQPWEKLTGAVKLAGKMKEWRKENIKD